MGVAWDPSLYPPGYAPPGYEIIGGAGDVGQVDPRDAPALDDPYGHYGAPTPPPNLLLPMPYPEPMPIAGLPAPSEPDAPLMNGYYNPPGRMPVVATLVVVTFATLVARLGPLVAGPVYAAIRVLVMASRNGRVAWNALPGFVKTALIAMGITVGVDIALDAADIGPEQPGGGITPWIPGPGESIGTIGTQMGGDLVVKAWAANGTPFVRLANGKMGARRKEGTWTFWMPKKPTVIFAGGKNDIRSLLRADSILDTQFKKIKKVLTRRTRTPSAKCSVCGYVRCRCKNK